MDNSNEWTFDADDLATFPVTPQRPCHVTRGEQLDRLLWAERFVDLYPIARQAVRAGVESYSIKKLEQYSGYKRRVELNNVHEPLLAVELAHPASAEAAARASVRRRTR